MASRRDGSLQKEKVAVTFANGVDQVTAEKLVVPGAMTRMENGVYNKVGEVEKRNGYDDLNVDVDVAYPAVYSTPAPFTGPITTGESAGVLEDELLLCDGNYIFSRSTTDGNWTYRDQCDPPITRSTRLGWSQTDTFYTDGRLQNPVDQDKVQRISHNGFTVYAWEATRYTSNVPQVYYSIIDEATGDRLVDSNIPFNNQGAPLPVGPGLLYGAMFSLRLVSAGNYIFLIGTFENAGLQPQELWMFRMEANPLFDATDPWPFWAQVNTLADCHPDTPWMDAIEISDTEIGIAYVREFNQTNYIRTMRVDVDGNTLATVDTNEDCNRCLSMYRDPVTGFLGIAWVNDHTIQQATLVEDVKLIVWDAALTNVPANWNVVLPGPFGMLINQEVVDTTEGDGATHISLGPGIQPDVYSVLWDTYTTLPAGTTYIPARCRVHIRQCFNYYPTLQAEYDVNGLANGIVGQIPLAAPGSGGDRGCNFPVYYASLATRQFERGNYIYFAVVQPWCPANAGVASNFSNPSIQNGLFQSSYGLMRFEKVLPAFATEPDVTTGTAQVNRFTNHLVSSVVGKFAQRVAGGSHSQGAVGRLSKVPSLDKYEWAGAEIAVAPQATDLNYTEDGVYRVRGRIFGTVIESASQAARNPVRMISTCLIDFSDLQNRYESITKNKTRLTAGGVLSSYDKRGFQEDGWVSPPEIWTLSGSNGVITDFWQFLAVYEWYDSRGQRHQSAPSQVMNFAVAHPMAASQTLYINIYGWHPKDTRIVVYRTLSTAAGADGGTFYRLSSHIVNPTLDPGEVMGRKGSPSEVAGFDIGPLVAVSYVQAVAGEADAAIQNNETFYTNGGVVANEEPPSSTCIEEWDGRVWLGGLEIGNQVAFSKTIINDESVNFSDIFRVEVGSQLTRVVALQSMDDKLVVFKEDSVYVIYGSGPNDLGQGASYRAQVVTSDQGCTGPKGVVRIPTGVLFGTDVGIYRLGRGLQVDFVGARVEDTTTGVTISGSDLVPAKTSGSLHAQLRVCGGLRLPSRCLVHLHQPPLRCRWVLRLVAG